MVEGSRYSQIAGIDPERLDEFRAGIRKRYSDEQILTELRASAERLGRSPTMREFAADAETTVHPQTVIGHFGSWNAAKRRAGLVPRRFATREELLDRLRELGEELGRTPTARDLETRRGSMPSKSLYWHTFGSLTTALREAGFDVPVGEERLARAIEQGVFLAVRSGRLPKFADWAEARRSDPSMLTEWQVYRMFEARRGAWSTFQFLVREQLAGQGVDVAPDGTLVAEQVALVRLRAAARSAHSGHETWWSSGSPLSSAANAPKAAGSPSISWRFSSCHEIVAFSSVSTTAHTLPGPQVNSCTASSAVAQRSRTPAPVSTSMPATSETDAPRPSSSVKRRVKKPAEVESAAAVEAVAPAHEDRVAGDVSAGVAHDRRPLIGQRPRVALDRA